MNDVQQVRILLEGEYELGYDIVTEGSYVRGTWFEWKDEMRVFLQGFAEAVWRITGRPLLINNWTDVDDWGNPEQMTVVKEPLWWLKE
jgi:hypothetical protein